MNPLSGATPFTDMLDRYLDVNRVRTDVRTHSPFWTTREFHDRNFNEAAGQRGDRRQITRDELQEALKNPSLSAQARQGIEYLLDPKNADVLRRLEERSGPAGDGSFTRRDLMETIKDEQRQMHKNEAEAPATVNWKRFDLGHRYCNEVVKTTTGIPRPKPPELPSTNTD